MIIIIDFGSQFSHLIAKKIRKLGVYSEILPFFVDIQNIRKKKPAGIIFSGGPDSVYQQDAPTINKEIFKMQIPILGICYGYQLIAYLNGGIVEKGDRSEFGITNISILHRHPLFEGLSSDEKVVMSHSDRVIRPPIGAEFIAHSNSASAAYIDDKNRIYGIQFHAEVDHTPNGLQILENFVKLCKAKKDWSTDRFLKEELKKLKKINEPVLMAVSGGIDSTVAATLLTETIPDLLHCVFIDPGLLRNKEAENIKQIYEKMFKNFYFIDAREEFFQKLQGITDPENKRKIIGKIFIEIFEEVAHQLEKDFGTIRYLGQGTIYPDRIESAKTSTKASVIKTHHNVGGLPSNMNLELVEPLKDLYKFEVRKLAKTLNINEKLIRRHPFPGPGLAVRCIGKVTEERIRCIQQADEILQKNLQHDSRVDYDKIWQSFFVLLPEVRSVGVMGDKRTYEHPGIIRIVESTDAMTATVPELPFDLLKGIAQEIVNKVPEINRVCLDLMGKPPGTIEWE